MHLQSVLLHCALLPVSEAVNHRVCVVGQCSRLLAYPWCFWAVLTLCFSDGTAMRNVRGVRGKCLLTAVVGSYQKSSAHCVHAVLDGGQRIGCCQLQSHSLAWGWRRVHMSLGPAWAFVGIEGRGRRAVRWAVVPVGMGRANGRRCRCAHRVRAILDEGRRVGRWAVAPIWMGRAAGAHVACAPVGIVRGDFKLIWMRKLHVAPSHSKGERTLS